jgi:hypothetical protein
MSDTCESAGVDSPRIDPLVARVDAIRDDFGIGSHGPDADGSLPDDITEEEWERRYGTGAAVTTTKPDDLDFDKCASECPHTGANLSKPCNDCPIPIVTTTERDPRTDAELAAEIEYGSDRELHALTELTTRLAEAKEARRYSILHHEETIADLAESRAEVKRKDEALRWVYLLGGGDTYMEMHGRLCFCPLHGKDGQHASACDEVNTRVLAALTPKEADGDE